MKLLTVLHLLVVVLFVNVAVGKEVQSCFYGSSYIKYDVLQGRDKPISSTNDQIMLQFRSSDASGLLLYADSRGLYGDHVLLELVSGKLRIRYQLGGNSTLKDDIMGDGLGDDILSTVTVKREKKKLTISAHGGQSDTKVIHIPGADDRLDLNGDVYVGGYLNRKQDYPALRKVNFKGCMMKAVFNEIDLLSGARRNLKGFSKSRVSFTTSPTIPSRAFNFEKETKIEIKIAKLVSLDPDEVPKEFHGSFAFRTTLVKGLIFQASAVTLTFQKSQLLLKSGSSDLVAIQFPNGGYASDGRWFEVKYSVTNTKMMLRLNNVTLEYKPANHPQYSNKILFGYNGDNYQFIGCIRDMIVQGHPITYREVVDPYRGFRVADYSNLLDGCKASDPCVPNPCFHEAQCLSYATGIDCDCRKNYDKPFCQFSQFKTTCSAIMKDKSIGSTRGPYYIDPDDSGPESPVLVTCDFKMRPTVGQTEIETKDAERKEIVNPSLYKSRFSFKKEIKYQIPLTGVKAIVDRSQTCEQYVKYECKNAKLFNQPGGIPLSRWLSANGYLQYYWGGALQDSYKCACAYLKKGCTDSKRFCNCDSAAAEATPDSDEGLINVTRDLPIREVQFGGLDDLSRVHYTVRKVVCYGVNTLGVVTFVAPDGWLRLHPWNSPLGGDISFYIKTVFAKGSLIDHRSSDENHFFLVRIEDATTIAVMFSLGTSIRTTYLARMAKGLGTLSDNKWHKIHVIRTLWEMSVRIDDYATTLVGSDEVKNSIPLTGDARSRLDIDLPIFVGAFWRFPIYKKGYVGCMKGFTVNGMVIDLANAVDHLTHEPEALVLKGCGHACTVNPCPYGKCVEGYTAYTCNCTDVPFYGKYCNQENGMEFLSSPVHSSEINVTNGWSKAERMILAFSTKAGIQCSGTLFEILSQNEKQYYKLILLNRNQLQFEFKLVFTENPVKITIPAKKLEYINFCDTNRHIVYFERNSTNWIKYKIDGWPMKEKLYRNEAPGLFSKPYFFYVGDNKKRSVTSEGGQFTGCISGAKFHFSLTSGLIKTVEPIMEALRTNTTGILKKACGPSINTPSPMITRRVPGPTTPTDYPSTEFLRDVGIHEAEDSNWAVLIVVALLMMLCLVAVVVLTIWFVMHHKNDYQILEKEDGTVVGTATVRGGNASMASIPAGANGAGRAPSQISQGNLSRAKSKSNDVFV